jgi:hypothetical protein
MNDLGKAIRDNPSKCLTCDEYGWCSHKVWAFEPKHCPKDKNLEEQK